MKILMDEDLRGPEWKPTIDRLMKEHDIIWVRDNKNNLRGLKDDKLGSWATENKCLVITRDKSSFLRDNFEKDQNLPYGLLVARIQSLSPEARAERVSSFLQEHGERLHGKCVILEPRTERIKTTEQAKIEFYQRKELSKEKGSEEYFEVSGIESKEEFDQLLRENPQLAEELDKLGEGEELELEYEEVVTHPQEKRSETKKEYVSELPEQEKDKERNR